MKSLAAAAGLALLVAGTPALAGGMVADTPVAVIVDDTSNSDGGILVPIVALILFAVAAAS